MYFIQNQNVQLIQLRSITNLTTISKVRALYQVKCFFHGPLWRHKQKERQCLPPFLIRQGLKNIKALFTSLLLELAEMEFWPAFVWFWPTVYCYSC